MASYLRESVELGNQTSSVCKGGGELGGVYPRSFDTSLRMGKTGKPQPCSTLIRYSRCWVFVFGFYLALCRFSRVYDGFKVVGWGRSNLQLLTISFTYPKMVCLPARIKL